MNLILRNILAVLLGIVIGTVINGWIISISGSIIPPPEGTDLTTTEGLQAALPLMEPKHFIMPFLAHGLGALLGAFMCATIAATHKNEVCNEHRMLISSWRNSGRIIHSCTHMVRRHRSRLGLHSNGVVRRKNGELI